MVVRQTLQVMAYSLGFTFLIMILFYLMSKGIARLGRDRDE